MTDQVYGAPAALTGSELVTIRQTQGGNLALCTMPLSTLLTWIQSQGGGTLTQGEFNLMMAAWLAKLPTTPPTQGAWLDNGVLSYVP